MRAQYPRILDLDLERRVLADEPDVGDPSADRDRVVRDALGGEAGPGLALQVREVRGEVREDVVQRAEHRALGEALDLERDELDRAIERYLESNPAFGHRGVRAGVTVPGLYDMQIRAMLVAARSCVERSIPVELEILVPMVAAMAESMGFPVWFRCRDEVRRATRTWRARAGLRTASPCPP
mgnify:CR=1 FL=1